MPTINFTTDMSGANNPIHSTNSVIFNFTLSSTYTIGKGSFDMKRGGSSANGVTATIYNGLNGSGSELASVFVSKNNIPTNFDIVDFVFNYGVTSGSYSLKLTSTDGSGGSTQYSIKTDSFKTVDPETGTTIQVFDENGNSISSTSTPTSTLTPTPTQSSTETLQPTQTPEPTPTPTLAPFTIKLYTNKIGYKNNQHVVKVINGV